MYICLRKNEKIEDVISDINKLTEGNFKCSCTGRLYWINVATGINTPLSAYFSKVIYSADGKSEMGIHLYVRENQDNFVNIPFDVIDTIFSL